jgi:hypothetical protein
MAFRYHDDDGNGEHYVTRIDYNHDTGGNPRNSIRFGYQPRPDHSSGFFAGAILRQTQRLTSITTYADETAVRRLTLSTNWAGNCARLTVDSMAGGFTSTMNSTAAAATTGSANLTLPAIPCTGPPSTPTMGWTG